MSKEQKKLSLAERWLYDDEPFKIIEEPEETKKSDDFTIYKADEDKRLVFGWASISITVDGEQLEDRQKDMIDPEDLEEAAYDYVLKFRDTGEEHIPTMRKKGKLVESCVLTAEKQKAMGIPEGTVPIGWWIGFKIEDDDAWARVKNGTYKMFSIEGKANREPVEKAQPHAMTFEEILKFNHNHGPDGRFAPAAGAGKGIVPANMQPKVMAAIDNLQGCNLKGEPIAGGASTEMCINPIPHAGKAVEKAIDSHMSKIDEFWRDSWEAPWNDARSSNQNLKVTELKSIQHTVSRNNLKKIMETGKSEGEFKDPICVIQYNKQYVVLNGNHRSSLAKLAGKETIEARVYNADE